METLSYKPIPLFLHPENLTVPHLKPPELALSYVNLMLCVSNPNFLLVKLLYIKLCQSVCIGSVVIIDKRLHFLKKIKQTNVHLHSDLWSSVILFRTLNFLVAMKDKRFLSFVCEDSSFQSTCNSWLLWSVMLLNQIIRVKLCVFSWY